MLSSQQQSGGSEEQQRDKKGNIRTRESITTTLGNPSHRIASNCCSSQYSAFSSPPPFSTHTRQKRMPIVSPHSHGPARPSCRVWFDSHHKHDAANRLRGSHPQWQWTYTDHCFAERLRSPPTQPTASRLAAAWWWCAVRRLRNRPMCRLQHALARWRMRCSFLRERGKNRVRWRAGRRRRCR